MASKEIQGAVTVINDDIQYVGSLKVNGGSQFVIRDQTDSSKSVIFNLSGLPTATQTEFTIPDSDSSLVTLTATQSLTNKSLDDTSTHIFDTAGPTKRGRFELSGVTAGQSRVMTWPDYNFTPASLAGTEILTNKTITSGVLDGATSVDGTSLDVSPSGNFTGNPGGNMDISVGGTGYVSLATTNGDVTLATNTAGNSIILSGAADGSVVDINSGLKLDYLGTAVSAETTWRSIIGVTDTTAARTITIPVELNIQGYVLIVKDESGAANVENITVTPESGTVDGIASGTISTAYGALRLYCNGTNWFTW